MHFLYRKILRCCNELLVRDIKRVEWLSCLVRRARPAGDAGPTEIFGATLDFAGDGFRKGEVVEF